jgi:hypothetical protein
MWQNFQASVPRRRYSNGTVSKSGGENRIMLGSLLHSRSPQRRPAQSNLAVRPVHDRSPICRVVSTISRDSSAPPMEKASLSTAGRIGAGAATTNEEQGRFQCPRPIDPRRFRPADDRPTNISTFRKLLAANRWRRACDKKAAGKHARRRFSSGVPDDRAAMPGAPNQTFSSQAWRTKK